MTPLPYTLTNESVTVIVSGKTHTVRKGAPNFQLLRSAILAEDWSGVSAHLTPAKSIKTYIKGKFAEDGDRLMYDGADLPSSLIERIKSMAAAGEDPTPLFKFWERLQKNPSYRSVRQLWGFLANESIPLTPDGCFLAYKSVRQDYKDHHSGTFENRPKAVLEMPRNQISDDPQVACHDGFHIGSLSYAKGFGSSPRRIMICKVMPENVVCVPHDSGQGKMRVCRYDVVGEYNGDALPSTTYADDPTAAEQVDALEPEETTYVVTDEAGNKNKVTAPKVGAAKITQRKVSVPKEYQKLAEMDMFELMEQPIDVLRGYAGKGLSIVGASKIPGGKASLVTKILSIRGG